MRFKVIMEVSTDETEESDLVDEFGDPDCFDSDREGAVEEAASNAMENICEDYINVNVVTSCDMMKEKA